MKYTGIALRREYILFLKLKNKYRIKRNIVSSFLLAIITVIMLLVPFVVEKALSFLFPSLKLKNKQTCDDIVVHNYIVRENCQKISLLQELNFFKSFYTPA